jgi:hypothetical protein
VNAPVVENHRGQAEGLFALRVSVCTAVGQCTAAPHLQNIEQRQPLFAEVPVEELDHNIISILTFGDVRVIPEAVEETVPNVQLRINSELH